MEYNSEKNCASNFKIGRARRVRPISNYEHGYPLNCVVRYEVQLLLNRIYKKFRHSKWLLRTFFEQKCLKRFSEVLKEHNRVFAHAQEFFNRRLRIQRCRKWYTAFTNPFASSSINFGFALKLLRIKDQWYTVLVKCQFVCNRHLSVLTSMPFNGTSSGGKCYGAGRRRLPFGSSPKGLENRETTEK